MSARVIPRLTADSIRGRSRAPFPEDMVPAARLIVDRVRTGGEPSLRRLAEELDGLASGGRLTYGPGDLRAAEGRLPESDLSCLQRTAARISAFAHAQRECLRPLDTPVPGGRAGHSLLPVARAGCYAPGGRYPLPSSVLMTVVTARAAGVPDVWLATPRPSDVMLAAASVAGASGVLAAGGAHAIAAMAYGVVIPRCNVIAGPGNMWVTAAKFLVSSTVGIDMLAGPSELVILADGAADPRLIAADLLAQSEHDNDAAAFLITDDSRVADDVERELEVQLAGLPTAAVAQRALAHGGVVVVSSLDDAINICDHIAPEHLQVMTTEPEATAARITNAGAIFIGPQSAEVFGDYGAGPNHVLPTGGTAACRAGLSVLTFVRPRTWMQLRPMPSGLLLADTARLARLEGLEAHARAAELRG